MSAPNGLDTDSEPEVIDFLRVLRSIDARLTALEDAVPALQRPVLPMLADIASDLTMLKAKLADYEPLIELVRQRADRGTMWRRNRGGTDGG